MGLESNHYKRRIYSMIYDALGAKTLIEDYLTVKPLIIKSNITQTVEEATKAVEDRIDAIKSIKASMSLDENSIENASPAELIIQEQQIATVTAAINTIDCNLPDGRGGAILTRAECSPVPKACG
jgi:hypothetical protein